MSGGDWCHFIQRVERIPLQAFAKVKADRDWEDEKFSYIVIRKAPLSEQATVVSESAPNTKNQKESEEKNELVPLPFMTGKFIRPPLKRGGHVIMDLCAHTGETRRIIIARSMGKVMYKAARKALWGDEWYGKLPEVKSPEDKKKPKKMGKKTLAKLAKKIEPKEEIIKPLEQEADQEEKTPEISLEEWEREWDLIAAGLDDEPKEN